MLGWQDDTYWSVQEALLETGEIISGRGAARGGSVLLSDAGPRKSAAIAVGKVPSVSATSEPIGTPAVAR